MSYSNYIIDHTITEYLIVSEPVSLPEAKLYCRVTTDADNNQIEIMIRQAREAIENVTGLTIVPKSVVVWFNNLNGSFEVPYGPVQQESFQLYDDRGNEITNYKLVGEFHPTLYYPNMSILKATYSVGYITNKLPSDLKIAMLDQINYDYENRGVDVNDKGLCEKTWRACQRWTRTSPIL